MLEFVETFWFIRSLSEAKFSPQRWSALYDEFGHNFVIHAVITAFLLFAWVHLVLSMPLQFFPLIVKLNAIQLTAHKILLTTATPSTGHTLLGH